MKLNLNNHASSLIKLLCQVFECFLLHFYCFRKVCHTYLCVQRQFILAFRRLTSLQVPKMISINNDFRPQCSKRSETMPSDHQNKQIACATTTMLRLVKFNFSIVKLKFTAQQYF